MSSSIEAQIAEVEREISMRRQVYPHQVNARKMRQSIADLQIERMEDVLHTLQSLQTEKRK